MSRWVYSHDPVSKIKASTGRGEGFKAMCLSTFGYVFMRISQMKIFI